MLKLLPPYRTIFFSACRMISSSGCSMSTPLSAAAISGVPYPRTASAADASPALLAPPAAMTGTGPSEENDVCSLASLSFS